METKEYNPAVLYSKLARITKSMKRIPKNGKHGQGYKFATEGDIIEAVSEALANENVAIISSMVGYEIADGGSTDKGKPIFHTICQFEFTLVCGDSGVSITSKWFNEALDSTDKGFNKATTAALKYFLMKTFLITTGEPDEHELGDEQPNSRKSNSTSQKRDVAPTKATTTQNGANSPLNANSDELDKPAAEKMIKHYEGKLTQEQLLEALHVNRFSEWTQGKKAAFVAIENHLRLTTMAAGTPQ